ncbi:MAG: acyl-CoA thioesterase [Deltaproteobacteria bacterium]|nr:acyl-CoA thioesterase [Deltaproteobacteria bacterium]
MPVHKTEIRVRFGDTDMAGVVYVPRYIHYFVCAFEEFFRSIGVPIEQTITNEIKGFPPTEIKCRFKAPAYCGDLLEVHTRVANIFKKGCQYIQKGDYLRVRSFSKGGQKIACYRNFYQCQYK